MHPSLPSPIASVCLAGEEGQKEAMPRMGEVPPPLPNIALLFKATVPFRRSKQHCKIPLSLPLVARSSLVHTVYMLATDGTVGSSYCMYTNNVNRFMAIMQ